jgi:hypothetical protein
MGASRKQDRATFRTWWLWVLAATLVAAGIEHYLRPALEAKALPTDRAEWIWANVGPEAGWVGFFAVRDFQIGSIPEERTTLLITADEEYVAFLNGEAVGSGSYRPGSGVDAYDVSSILVAGDNRLLVELRSAHSVGGLLLNLTTAGESLVVSDGSWGVLEEYREEEKWPGTATGDLLPVKVWGRPPTGRWGRPESAQWRPRLRRQLLSRRPLPAELVRLGDNGPWYPLPPEPLRERPLGHWATFDFGREVSGFVNLVPARRSGARGLFWLGSEEPPDPRSSRPDGRVFALVGQGSWTDALPRRFRYVTVVSLTEIAGARAFVLKPRLEEELVASNPQPAGVLGLEPPELRSPVEDEFWREFESLTSLGGGETP